MVSTEELARSLSVSGETIRRNLTELERQVLLTRVRGGAAPARSGSGGEEAPFGDRAVSNGDAKDRIGQAPPPLSSLVK